MRERLPRAALALLLAAGVAGCESMQKKFVRKKTGEVEVPSPVITFEDYNRSVTPLDLYRKHYLMFEYWNSELQNELESATVNPKRVRLASEESLTELGMLQRLLTDEAGAPLAPVIEERRRVDRQLQAGGLSRHQAQLVKKTIDQHGRLMNGQYFWRSVEGQVRPQAEAPAEAVEPEAIVAPSGHPAVP